MLYRLHLLLLYLRRHTWLMAASILILTALWSAAFYFIGFASMQHQVRALYLKTVGALQDDGVLSEGDLVAWLKTTAMQARLSEQTVENLRLTLSNRERDIAELKEQVYFYRAIIAPEEAGGDLSIISARLERSRDARKFPFELVLHKAGRPDTAIRGRISLALLDGAAPTARRLQTKAFYAGDTKFGFKYFQRMKGVITLPQDFDPVQLEVSVSPTRGKQKLKQLWYWGDLLGGAHVFQRPPP